jgi:hypothetical protein
MLPVDFFSWITLRRHSALSRSTWRPFGSERLDMSSSTCLTAEGLSIGSWPKGSVGVVC